MNSYNPYNQSIEYNNTPPDVRIGDNSSGDVKNIGQNLGPRNPSNVSESHSSGHDPNDMNSSKKIHESSPEKTPLFKREEKTQKPAEVEPDFYPLTKDDTIVYNESEYIETIKSEQENLEVLLKDLYTGSSKKDVLSDQKMNEPYLSEFFKKYPQSKTDFLAIMLAGLYLALDDIENAKTKLARIRDPDLTEDDNNNAGYHRAYYMIMASLKTEEKNFKKARELLKQSWNIPQRFFAADKENFLDFYSTIMGRIHLKEGYLKEAEECFKDALAQRLLSKNSRLISSSYNDLALLYIENRSGINSTKGDDEKALQYLNKAREYDKVFQQELDSKKYDVLLGQVDYKRPDINKTEEAYKKLQKP